MELFIISFVSYLIGSIPFGLLLTKIFLKKDIRAVGSGNIGTTNVLRTGNKLLVVSSDNSIILQKTDFVKQEDDYSLMKYAKNIANKIGIKI